ncbi:hypothetical protein [Erysipelothrix aquatica]|uniref:hypothetical protein n=1 Tax=Erysipelothrix aquatica TaxID=2683714 RepID=UPI0013567BB9|nr:hypothetical protein [Erysipelothrix aquatica]
MSYELDRAVNKRNRLQNEVEQYTNEARDERRKIPLGQPNIIGRPDIYKRSKQLQQKAFNKMDELDKQNDRIEMLEHVEQFKDDNELIKDVHVVGKTGYATIGAKTSVNNIEYFKDKLYKLEQANEEAKTYNKTRDKNNDRPKKTYGADITKLKNKIAYLESLEQKSENDKKSMSAKTVELIENGLVKQWAKKPIYFFVSGLKKVALEINESGNFEISNRYPAYSDEDREYIYKLLK